MGDLYFYFNRSFFFSLEVLLICPYMCIENIILRVQSLFTCVCTDS